jgi:hypothetical protein
MEGIQKPGPIELPAGIRWFMLALVFFTACCGLVELVCRKVAVLHRDRDPYIYPFLREHYPDFLLLRPRFNFFHSAAFFSTSRGSPFMYPAPVGVVYRLFYAMPNGGLSTFLGFVLLSFTVAGLLFGRALQRRGMPHVLAYLVPPSVLLLSFPVWFELKQANMEIMLWILITAGVALFLAGRGYPAAVCFGIAASMKIYPLAYLGLLLIRRQYRQITVALTVGIATTVASLWVVGDSIGPAWQRVSEGVTKFRFLYMLHKRREMAFDHSLLSVIKLPMHPFPTPERFAPILTVYLVFVFILGFVLFFFRIWRMPAINQILFLTVACILLPPVSFEYTLLHLFVPLGLLTLFVVDVTRHGEPMPSGVRPAMACFAILLAPLSEVALLGRQLDGQIKAGALVVLLFVAATRPFMHRSTNEGRDSHA